MFRNPIAPGHSQTFSTTQGPGFLNIVNPNDVAGKYSTAFDGELPTTYRIGSNREKSYKMPKGQTAVVTNLRPYTLNAELAAVQGDASGE